MKRDMYSGRYVSNDRDQREIDDKNINLQSEHFSFFFFPQ